MSLANFEILSKLFVDICNFVVFGDDEVDFCTGLLKLRLAAGCLLPSKLHLLAKCSPFLLFAREKLHLLSYLVLQPFLLELLGGDVELQLLAILLLLLQLALIDRYCRLQLSDACLQPAVLILNSRQALVQIGLFPHQGANVALSLVALLADRFRLAADSCVFAPSFLDLLAKLAQLEPRPFLLHFFDLVEAFLFLEANPGFSGLIFLAVLVGDELLGCKFGLLEGLCAKSKLFLQMFCLQLQLVDAAGGQLEAFLIGPALCLVLPKQRFLPRSRPPQLLLDSVVFLLVAPQRLNFVLEGGDDCILLVHAGGEVLGGQAQSGLAGFADEAHFLFRNLIIKYHPKEYKNLKRSYNRNILCASKKTSKKYQQQKNQYFIDIFIKMYGFCDGTKKIMQNQYLRTDRLLISQSI